MIAITISAYVVSALAIATYLYLAVTGDGRAFNWVNAFGWPVFFASLAVHAYPAAVLNLFFTLVGTIGVIQDHRVRKAEATWVDVVEALDDGRADVLFTADHPTISVPWSGGQN